MIELAIVVPTFNEKDNIVELVVRLERVLDGIQWEVLFVDDDSPDGTAEHVRQKGLHDPRIRCVHRIGRRGLSSACIEGMLASCAPYLAVMDADLQHDETLLQKMFTILTTQDIDLVVASRYAQGGTTGEWSRKRALISRVATFLSKVITTHADLKDPLSGFFMLKRPFFEQSVRRLNGKGFKILLDLCASSTEKIKFKELSFQFKPRNAGQSKLGTVVVSEYFYLIADKMIGRYIPVRFISFILVGVLGACVHLSALGIGLKAFNAPFWVAQSWAAFFAMTVNFFFNNIFTYYDNKLQGWRFWQGLVSFYLVCGLGMLVNLRMATLLYDQGIAWWLAGLLGALVGGIWNYAVSSSFTWKNK